MFLLCEDGLLLQAATVRVVVDFGTVSLSVSLALMCRNKISYLLSYRFSLILWQAVAAPAAERWSELSEPASSWSVGAPLPGKGEWDGWSVRVQLWHLPCLIWDDMREPPAASGDNDWDNHCKKLINMITGLVRTLNTSLGGLPPSSFHPIWENLKVFCLQCTRTFVLKLDCGVGS